LLDPRAESLTNLYEDIFMAVKKVTIGAHCTFRPNKNTGFSKEDLLHVAALHKQFKALHAALQLCVSLAEDGCMSVDMYSIIVTILYTMCLQLDMYDNIYIKHIDTGNLFCAYALQCLPTGTKMLCPVATLYCPHDNGISSQ